MARLLLGVECYAGYRGEQEPRRLRFGSRTLAVAEILDRWLGPDHRYFKLSGEDGGLYILRHDETARRWELIFYARDGAAHDAGQQEPPVSRQSGAESLPS